LPLVKRQKRRHCAESQGQCLSKAVFRVQQPIEALFARIEEKTGIDVPVKFALLNLIKSA
jgi:hypothetical protein